MIRGGRIGRVGGVRMVRADHVASLCSGRADRGEVISWVNKIAGRAAAEVASRDAGLHTNPHEDRTRWRCGGIELAGADEEPAAFVGESPGRVGQNRAQGRCRQDYAWDVRHCHGS